MEKPLTSPDDVRRALQEVLREWRVRQLATTREMILNVQDKIEALSLREHDPFPDQTAELRARLEEHATRLDDQRSDRVRMIEESYRQMLDFVTILRWSNDRGLKP